MDVGDHSSSSNGGLDQGVKFFVSPDGKLEMPRSYSLDLQVLGGVSCKLEDLSCEVLKDGSSVHSGCGSDSRVRVDSALQESMDPSNGELSEL